jgi:CBS domain-containing protein
MPGQSNQADADGSSSTTHSGTKYDQFLNAVKYRKPREIPVREFLGYWGYKRRGATITKAIEKELNNRGLVSFPEIAKADYYGSVKILDRRDMSADADVEIGWPISSVLDVERQLTFVGKDTSLAKVETLMVMHNFSQIPVLSNSKRELYGSVTWKSLARWPSSREDSTAKQAMDTDNHTVRSSDNLIDHIGLIIVNEFVYIQSPSNEYVGILTSTDLAESFLATSGPFIKIGEIEHRIRLLVDQLPLPVIQGAKLPSDIQRDVGGASDLTFGEYIRILEDEINWNQIGLAFDRATIVNNLRAVNEIRNDVMHFRPNPLDPQMVEAIDWCLNWLREVRLR